MKKLPPHFMPVLSTRWPTPLECTKSSPGGMKKDLAIRSTGFRGVPGKTFRQQGRTDRCGLIRSTQNKELHMGIRMIPEQFDQNRRRDPKRAAEARVFDALQNLDLDGYGLYEFRYRREGRQLDFALWLNMLGRLAMQVKGASTALTTTVSGSCTLRKRTVCRPIPPWRRRRRAAPTCTTPSRRPPASTVLSAGSSHDRHAARRADGACRPQS